MFGNRNQGMGSKLNLSLSLDAAALSAAQISGATEVLLVNKLLNQCLGTLSLSFSSDNGKPFSLSDAQVASESAIYGAKRKLPSEIVGAEKSPIKWKGWGYDSTVARTSSIPLQTKKSTNSPSAIPSCRSNSDCSHSDQSDDGSYSGRDDAMASQAMGNDSSKSRQGDSCMGTSTSTKSAAKSLAHADPKPDTTMNTDGVNTSPNIPKVTFVDGSSSTSLAANLNTPTSTSCSKQISPRMGKQENESNENSDLVASIKEEFTCDESDTVAQNQNSPSDEVQNPNQRVPYFPGLQIPHSMNFRSPHTAQPSCFPNTSGSFGMSSNLLSFPRPQHYFAGEPVMLGAARPGGLGAIGLNQNNPSSNGTPLGLDPSAPGISTLGASSKVEMNGDQQSTNSSYHLGRLRGRPSAVDSEMMHSGCAAAALNEDSSRNQFTCHLCSYSANRIELVRSHLRNYHSTLRPFKCILCAHACKTKCNLISHYRGLHRMDVEDARRYAKSSHNSSYPVGPQVPTNEFTLWAQQHSHSSNSFETQVYDANIATVADPIAAEVAAMSSQAIDSAIENSDNVVSTLLSQDKQND